MLFELVGINVRFGYCGIPAIIGQVDSVAEPLDAALKDVKGDVLDVELFFHFSDEKFHLAVCYFCPAWTHVIGSFA